MKLYLNNKVTALFGRVKKFSKYFKGRKGKKGIKKVARPVERVLA